jgi:cell division protein FtsQ
LLAILFFESSISKISKIEISGNELVSADTIGQASGIAVGERFFAVSSGTIARNIESLQSIETVKVSKRFPGLIRIEVKEYARVAFQFAESGGLQAILADGSAINADSSTGFVMDKPLLSGWQDSDPNKAELCKSLGSIPDELLSDISEIRPSPSESYPDKIKLYTRSKFEVYTTIEYLPQKLQYLGLYIKKLQDNHVTNGTITMLESDNYAPFAVP